MSGCWPWSSARRAELRRARRGAPYYSGLVRQRRSRRRGAAAPGAAGRRQRGAQHGDLLDRHRRLARSRASRAKSSPRASSARAGPASAFTIAFQVPNLVSNLFANAALSAAFVPVFTDLLQQGRRKEAFRLASTLFWIMLIVLGAVTAFFILARGRDHAAVHRAARSTRALDALTVGPLAGAVPGRAAARAERPARRDPAVLRPLHDPGDLAGGVERRDHRAAGRAAPALPRRRQRSSTPTRSRSWSRRSCSC